MNLIPVDNQQVLENQIQYYVGVGASAGGLEALELLFSNMPVNTGITFIVIQHLSPDYKSMMVELLSKRTDVEVKRAEDGMLAEPNKIYLIPPKKNLSIFHGKLLLTDLEHSKGINLPIDFFLKSLAEDQGDKSIAIILSGTGSDGVKGLRAVKEAGGMVMVQSEETAKFDGMPKSAISTGLADFILPPEQMPKTLISFVKHPYAGKLENSQAIIPEEGLTRIYSLLREKTKVDFTFYKATTIVRRIERRITVNQNRDLKDYVKYLETNPGELTILFKDLLIGVTSFFRDKEVFDNLVENFFDKLFDFSKKEIRIWVAGCSTGEEAYTLAILCREYMERKNTLFDLKIFATDIDKDAIVRAGSGIYSESIAVDLPTYYLNKYFHLKDNQFQIDRSIRETVVFAQHNVFKDPPFTNLDLITCRNLLIYFQPVLQKRVLELFNFSLKQDGILLLGTSETIGEMADYFESGDTKDKIYLARGKKNPGTISSEFVIQTNQLLTKVPLRAIGGGFVSRSQEEDRFLERVLNSLVGEYVSLAIVVNEQMEVLHILGDTAPYFHLPSGKITNDISKIAAKDLAIPLATGIQKVFKSKEEIRYNNVRLQNYDESKTINLKFKLVSSKKGQVPIAIVFLDEVSKQKFDKSKEVGLIFDIGKDAEQRIYDLEQELQFNKENLQATIEELETSNEELQATNEELLASNEELQSTNEELQSVNEELHTVNAEFQSKIIELTELNNDFDNLLANIKIGTMFLDENLELRKYSSEIKKIFKISGGDVGRHVSYLLHSIVGINLFELISDVDKNGTGKELVIVTQEGSSFLMSILPYKIGNGIFSGIVLSFVDITEYKKIQNALYQSENRLASLFKTLPLGIGVIKEGVFEEVNQKMCDLFHYANNELIGSTTEKFYENVDEFIRVGHQIDQQIQNNALSVIETTWFRKDKTAIPILLSVANTNNSNNENRRTITVLDLSVRKKAIQDAIDFESQFQYLFDSMAQGVVYHDNTGKISTANKAAQRLLGLTLDQLLGRTSFDPRWKAIKQDETDFKGQDHPAMVALKTGKKVLGQVMGVYNPVSNNTTWLLVNAIPLFKEGENEVDRIFVTFDDITNNIEDEIKIKTVQRRLDQALKISGLAWWEFDLLNNKVDSSELRANYLGFDLSEVGSDLEFWNSRIHKDDYKKTIDAMNKYLKGKTNSYIAEYRMKAKNNKYKWFRDIGEIVEAEKDGTPIKLIGTTQKIDKNIK